MDERTRELNLARAHLLCQRDEFEEAERLLLQMRRALGRDSDVEDLLARIQVTEQVDKVVEEKRRYWRFALGLQSTARRIGWGLVSILFLLYGGCEFFPTLSNGYSRGFTTLITTQVQVSRGRYSSGRWVPWTRPIYIDVLYDTVFIVVGAVMMVILVMVSRGSAQWEELNDPDIQ
jgi:hypothetical protein